MSTMLASEEHAVGNMLQDKFLQMKKDLSSSLIERDDEITLTLRALLSNDHVLLVGDPGTAKSLLCETFGLWLDGGVYFEWLLTKFSVPEEIFGPISVSGMQQDDYRRVTDHKLPQAHFAFLDEIFKASSAILNTMLKVLNERTFANGRGIDKCPLQLCMAASNEWPSEQEELGALFDRFLYRKNVLPIRSRKGLDELLWSDDLTPALSDSITPCEIATVRREVEQLPVSVEAKQAFREIVKEIRAEGVFPGDRRLRRSVGACRAAAWLDGDSEVKTEHLEVLADILWVDPQEQPLKVAQVVGRIANPTAMQVNTMLMEAEQILQNVDATDLGQAAGATAKLQDVAKRLKAVSGNGRAASAVVYVKDEIKRLKLAAVESL